MTDKISFARSLRCNPTPAEKAFWAILYTWREAGMHWRRQAPIGPYVVDFCCRKRKLIVEIDGDSHYLEDGIARDAARTTFLQARGFRVVRFSNLDVLQNAPGVFDALRGILGEVNAPR